MGSRRMQPIAVILRAFTLYITLTMAYGQHPSFLLRGKEPSTSDWSSPLLKPLKRVIQPKPIIDDCMELPRRPSGRDLDKRRLFRKLGGEENFDQRYSSITKPQSDEPVMEEISLRRVSTAEKNHLREVIRNETKHMAGISKGKAPAHVERFMMKWLLQKSFCPVEYAWRDMGLCYWPRWLSLGSCANKVCSWPSEMQCKPSESTSVHMLRWHCSQDGEDRRTPREPRKRKQRNKNKRRRKCRWLPIRYPVTTRCKCSCDRADEILRA